MLANVLLFCGITVALLTLLEVLLSESQKQRLAVVVTRVWSRLDDVASIHYVQWIKGSAFAVIFPAASALVAIALISSEWDQTRFSITWRIGSGVGCVLAFLVSRSLLRFAVSSAVETRDIIKKLFLLNALTLGPVVLVRAAMDIFGVGDSANRTDTAVMLALPAMMLWVGILIIIVGMVGAKLMSRLLRGFEFTVRRIAEYPKGPMLGLSATFGAIAALLKACGT